MLKTRSALPITGLKNGILQLLKENNVASIAYGGVAPLSICATKTKEFLVGKKWTQNVVKDALNVLRTDILLKKDASGGMVEFRKSLTLSFFLKFFLWVSRETGEKKSTKESISSSHLSAIMSFHRPPLVAIQDYEILEYGTSVGSPEVHVSSRLQVCNSKSSLVLVL